MADARELEAKANRDPKSVSSDEFDLLARHYWQLALDAKDYRDRRKLLKRSSYFAGHAFEAGLEDPDTLRLYMDIARQTAQIHAFPQDERRKLSLITGRWLTVTGAGEHTVLARAKGKADTETATFGLGDIGLAPDAADSASYDDQMVDCMAKGQRLYFGTGYDGTIKAEIRIIEGVEPVLTPKEYAKLTTSTPSMVLEAPTGRIALSDHAHMTEPWTRQPLGNSVVIETAPGNYKTCVFGFSTPRWDSVIAILCRTESTPPNSVSDVDSLFM